MYIYIATYLELKPAVKVISTFDNTKQYSLAG